MGLSIAGVEPTSVLHSTVVVGGRPTGMAPPWPHCGWLPDWRVSTKVRGLIITAEHNVRLGYAKGLRFQPCDDCFPPPKSPSSLPRAITISVTRGEATLALVSPLLGLQAWGPWLHITTRRRSNRSELPPDPCSCPCPSAWQGLHLVRQSLPCATCPTLLAPT